MGGDIVVWVVYKGFEVILQDCEECFIDLVMECVQVLFVKKVCDESKCFVVVVCLCVDLEGNGVVEVDLVIEVIIENLEVKCVLYQMLELKMKQDVLLIINILLILLVELCDYIQCLVQFVGLYYFNLVVQMLLVEIIYYDGMVLEIECCLVVFCKVLGKFLVLVVGSLGFLVNCVLFLYMLEVVIVYVEGILGLVIDKVVVKFGMLMGLIELIDIVGLDVVVGVGCELVFFLGLQILVVLQMVELDKCGKKDG